MAVALELRRQAIAAALRAVMAEPLPSTTRAVALPPATPVARPTAAPTLGVAPEVSVTGPEAAHLPSLRDSLVAEIDWDEVEGIQLESSADWESPSVPPLELKGGMSSTASMALFGHA